MASTTNTNVGEPLVLNIEELIKDLNCDAAAVCVYRVPNSLSYAKPEVFTPQFVGLGPYHHLRPGVHTKQKWKLAAAKRVLKDLFNDTELSKLVGKLRNLNLRLASSIRDCYDCSIKIRDDDTLLYLMTVDALFLYYLLHSLVIIAEGTCNDDAAACIVTKFSLNISILTGKQGMPKDAIIRDVFMLENQIPTCVLMHIMTVTSKETEMHENVDEYVGSKMQDFCRALCPLLKIGQLSHKSEAVKHVHLLDLMYHLIVPQPEPKLKSKLETHTTEPKLKPKSKPGFGIEFDPEFRFEFESKLESESEPEPKSEQSRSSGTCCFKCCYIPVLLLIFCWVMGYIVSVIFRALVKILDLIVQLARLCSSAAVEMLRETLTNWDIQPLQTLADFVKGIQNGPPNSDKGPRPAITIPSVTELHNAGIHFQPAKSGISSIKFDERKSMLYLPVIRVDVNSQVIITNLVAYELLIRSECLLLTRYVELMRAIIDTAEDVKLLVKEKIIQTQLNDEQVAQLFNGMSNSFSPTNTPKLEKEIKKLNDKFDSAKKVSKVMAKYVYRWKIFTFVGALVYLALKAMRVYCSLYSRSRAIEIGKLREGGDGDRNNYFISSI